MSARSPAMSQRRIQADWEIHCLRFNQAESILSSIRDMLCVDRLRERSGEYECNQLTGFAACLFRATRCPQFHGGSGSVARKLVEVYDV